MSTVLSEESPTTVMQRDESIISIQNPIQSTSDNTQSIPMMSSSSITGENLLAEALPNGEKDSGLTNGTNSVISSSNLKSHAKPQEILEKEVKPRILKVSKDDIDGIVQMLQEFREAMEWSFTR